MVVVSRPDDERRGQRQQFPADKQCHQIAGQHRADGTAGIEQRRADLQAILHMQCVDDADQCGDVKEQCKEEGEPVDLGEDQIEAEERNREGGAVGQAEQPEQTDDWGRQSDDLARNPAQDRTEDGAHDEGQQRVQALNHRSSHPFATLPPSIHGRAAPG